MHSIQTCSALLMVSSNSHQSFRSKIRPIFSSPQSHLVLVALSAVSLFINAFTQFLRHNSHHCHICIAPFHFLFAKRVLDYTRLLESRQVLDATKYGLAGISVMVRVPHSKNTFASQKNSGQSFNTLIQLASVDLPSLGNKATHCCPSGATRTPEYGTPPGQP